MAGPGMLRVAMPLQTSTSVPCPPGATSAPTAASTYLEASSAAAPHPATGWPPTGATAKVRTVLGLCDTRALRPGWRAVLPQPVGHGTGGALGGRVLGSTGSLVSYTRAPSTLIFGSSALPLCPAVPEDGIGTISFRKRPWRLETGSQHPQPLPAAWGFWCHLSLGHCGPGLGQNRPQRPLSRGANCGQVCAVSVDKWLRGSSGPGQLQHGLMGAGGAHSVL